MRLRGARLLGKVLGPGGPLGIFHEYPVLLRLGLISMFAEMGWATLIVVMEYFFLKELLQGQAEQYIASRVAMALLAFVVCEAALKMPMGWLSDRIGPRPVVIFALSLACVSPLIMVFAQDWYWFIPLRALDGIAAAALWPSMSALMARAVPRNAKATAMSVFNGAYCMGLAIGPMIGLYMGHLLGSNRWVFPLCSAFMFIGVLIALWVLRPRAAARPGDKPEFWQLPQRNGGPLQSKGKTLLHGRPMLVRMMALYALSQTAVGVLATVLPIYLKNEFNIDQQDLPRMIVAPAILVAFVALPIGRLADHIGRARAVWISYAMASFGMLIVALAPIEEIFGIGFLFLVFSYILGTPAWLGLTSLQVDDSRQAGALSLMQTAQGVGVIVGLGAVASAGTLLTQWNKVEAAFTHQEFGAVQQTQNVVPISMWLWVAVVVFTLCFIGTLLFIREPDHDEHAEELAESAKQPLEITGV